MSQENIFLFVPNLIGYARVLLALLSFYLMPTCPWPAVFFYLLSGLLDAFDGHAAGAEPVHQVRSHAGHADGPLRHHVSAGQPVAALPRLHLPVPAQHVSGRRQPLAAPAQLHRQRLRESQEHRPVGEPRPAGLLHLQAGSVRDVRRERAVLLSAVPAAPHPGAGRLAAVAAGTLRPHLSAQVRHQRPAPGHRRPEHGRPGRRRAREGGEAAVRRPDERRAGSGVLTVPDQMSTTK